MMNMLLSYCKLTLFSFCLEPLLFVLWIELPILQLILSLNIAAQSIYHSRFILISSDNVFLISSANPCNFCVFHILAILPHQKAFTFTVKGFIISHNPFSTVLSFLLVLLPTFVLTVIHYCNPSNPVLDLSSCSSHGATVI